MKISTFMKNARACKRALARGDDRLVLAFVRLMFATTENERLRALAISMAQPICGGKSMLRMKEGIPRIGMTA